MGIGPIPAVRKLLGRVGIDAAEISLVELNEAFASQSLVVIRELGLDPEKVNVNGGAIALGHPLGMSGARLVVTLLHELRRRDGRYGLATLCVGRRPGSGRAVRTWLARPSSTSCSGCGSGRHVDGLVDAYYGPEELERQVDAEPLFEPEALVGRRRRAPRFPRGRLASRPGGRAANVRRRPRRRGDVVLGRGGGVLRRAAGARRHRRSTRRRTAASTQLLPGDGTAGPALRRLAAREHWFRPSRSCRSSTEIVGELRARDRLRSSTFPPGEERHPRRGRRRAVVGVQLLPRRPAQPCGRQRGRSDHLRRPGRARPRTRSTPATTRSTPVKEQLLHSRPRSARGGDPARPDARGARQRGYRRDWDPASSSTATCPTG